ncbi:Iron sulfur cluster assembly protein, mitochondrial [Penicillium ucsense]|uniref:Iron-sulfur cluster assembly protein n=2 Tax=Penicillium TaxID=5073 RepID=A0A8J8W995_9EURO|nr:Iron sulfur cluster assembly protein 1 [Penicillium diatomitis]XP_056789156.1 Iron sulfur cluster assembly protein 1 [Penicillium diatomitis]KAF7719113.1 Iron sulfur cluster assembly protein, mitochondrial [Penicillium ucsense]KAF7738099.1 Iron sulfur cluster assembly protein, mitochondrial [Penicillium ucsense]KAJ5474957.1 Iron sulfur cluster assembly protein 1 [Penicillium diatomitis]KAJ5483886.1 Iron sulfur cluster assembly protein 1 [Penicillium diatomitis]
MFKRLVTVAPRVGVVAPRAFAPLAGVQSVQPIQRQTSAPTQRRSYHEKVLDHYNNPRNVGSFKNEQDVGTGLVGAPACGDVMKLQIRVNKDSGRIDDVVFKTFGCGSAIASSSYLTELVRGMTLDEAGKIKNTDVAKELCLPPVKLHCSMLAEDAIKSAISDYYTKNPKAKTTDLSGTGASMANVKVEIEQTPTGGAAASM